MLGKGKKKGKEEAGGDAEAEKPAVDGEGGEAAEEGGKKKLPMKLIIVVVAAAVFLAGGGGAAFFLLKPKHPPVKVAEVKPKAKKKEKGKDAKPEEGMGKVSDGPGGISYYAFPSVLSDMQGADGKPGQIKLDMTFEIANADVNFASVLGM